MASKYKVGDTVQLKSGGPKMTVTKPADSYDNVVTMWFAGAKRETGSFPPDAIQPYEEPKK